MIAFSFHHSVKSFGKSLMAARAISMAILSHTLFSFTFRASLLWCGVEQVSLSNVHKQWSRALISGDEGGHSSLVIFSSLLLCYMSSIVRLSILLKCPMCTKSGIAPWLEFTVQNVICTLPW